MTESTIANELRRVASLLKTARVQFDTAQFRGSHGREPKGRGSWAFSTDRRGDENLLFSPSMTYADAKKWAVKQPAFKGAFRLYVQP